MARDLSLLFESTAELYTLRPIPAANRMPAGWCLRMPMGERYASAEMFTLEPRRHGAYRLVTSERGAQDRWEEEAICLLGDIAAAVVTDGAPMTDELAEKIACAFHLACLTGGRPKGFASLDASLAKVLDPTAMWWVTVKQGAEGRR